MSCGVSEEIHKMMTFHLFANIPTDCKLVTNAPLRDVVWVDGQFPLVVLQSSEASREIGEKC